MKKWIKLICGSALVAASLLYTSWFIFVYQPDLHHIRRWVAIGNHHAEPILTTLYPLAIERETEAGIKDYALSQAYLQTNPPRPDVLAIARHSHRVLWWMTTRLLLTNTDSFGLWVSCAYSACGRGLATASQQYFDKDMSELGLEEQAALVVLVRSPSSYQPSTERSQSGARTLLNRYRTRD